MEVPFFDRKRNRISIYSHDMLEATIIFLPCKTSSHSLLYQKTQSQPGGWIDTVSIRTRDDFESIFSQDLEC